MKDVQGLFLVPFYQNQGLFLKNIFKERVISLDCLIASADGNLYISVTQNGDITTSNKAYAKVFDEYKAKKLLKHLPKRLRKNGFSIQPIVEEKIENPEPEIAEIEEIVIQEDYLEPTTDDNDGDYLINENYKVPSNVLMWVDRVQEYNRFISDAAMRYRDLEKALSIMDDQYQNITHHIEMDNNKNGCEGYFAYKNARKNRRIRRKVKDEMWMISKILELSRNKKRIPTNKEMTSFVKHLENRRYRERKPDDRNIVELLEALEGE